MSTQARREGGGKARKTALHRRVTEAVPIGILGYLEARPVAWCSIAPRDSCRSLGGPEALPQEGVWSLVCFFIAREMRKQGILPQLLHAAEAYGRRQGATVIEAYPVGRGSPSFRFMGFLGFFSEAGYRRVGRVGSRRHVVQKRLGPAKRRGPPSTNGRRRNERPER